VSTKEQEEKKEFFISSLIIKIMPSG